MRWNRCREDHYDDLVLDRYYAHRKVSAIRIPDLAIQGVSVRLNAALADARVFWANDGYEIEYNPHRPRGRVNFSIAHEIAHTFFRIAPKR